MTDFYLQPFLGETGPGVSIPQGCIDFVQTRGGWENLTAEEATLFSQSCYPISELGDYGRAIEQADFPDYQSYEYPIQPMEYAAPSSGTDIDEVRDVPRTEPAAPVPETQPLWTGQVQEPSQENKTVFTDPDFGDNPIAWLGPVITASGPLASAFQQTGGDPSLGQVIEQASKTLLPMFFQNDQIQAGITSFSGPNSCWNPTKSGKLSRRAQVRIIRTPQGPQLVKYCRPKRMNPCNPRALARAARRLGSFQRMAGHVEKIIARACKTKSRRYSRMPASSCGPKKCR